jgi:tetratricopeptide (TPR) repeat protein
MYLRGVKWNMARRSRRRGSVWRIVFLLAGIGVLLYINQVVVPATPPLFIPTPTPTTSPEAYVNQAQDLAREGKLNQAIQAYQNAIYTDPTNPSNFVELARLQVFAGEYEEAVENTQNALLKNPNNALAHAVLGWALGFQEKYGEAEREIKNALEIDPNNALAHAYYAEILINQGNFDLFDKAAEESKKARDLDPNLLETHRARGIVLFNTQNLEEAIQEFESAIAINKNIADLYLYLGVTYKAMQDFGNAEENLLKAYALNPQDPVGLTELSLVYFGDGKYAQSAQYAEEAVRVESTNPRLRGNLGIAYYKNEDFNKAIEELTLAVRGGVTKDGDAVEGLPLDYGRVESYYWYLGFALSKSGRCAEAIPVANALINGVPADEIAIYNAQQILIDCQAAPSPTPEAVDAEATPEP